MSVSLVFLLVLLVLGVTVSSGATTAPRLGIGVMVRHLFQFGLLLGLVEVVAFGISGLIERALQQRDVLATASQSDLARGLAFTLVGVPLLLLIAQWTRRRFSEDPREAQSIGWSFYLTLAELSSLAVAAFAAQDVLLWALRSGPYDASAIARLIAWGAVWMVHLRVARRTSEQPRAHEFGASAFGLWFAAWSMARLVSATILAATGAAASQLVQGEDASSMRATAGLVVGAAVWLIYWMRRLQFSERNTLWHGYIMLAGVGGGLVVAIVSASVALNDTLVWFLGTPDATDPATHFRSSISAAGTFLAGVLVWWYHRSVLAEAGTRRRDEARRVYEYLIAFIALIAAAVGCMILIVAGLEAATSSIQLAGSGAGNTLILAVTLLVVGAPLWWRFWHGAQRVFALDSAREAASAARRVYLFMLFGAVGVAAVVALLIDAYLLFQDLVAGNLGLQTLRSMRWALAILVTAAVVAQYHWRIYRAERTTTAAGVRRRVVLVGVDDPGMRQALRDRLHARVEVWPRLDAGDHAPWDIDAVVQAVSNTSAQDVLVFDVGGGVRALPVDRP